MPRSKARRASYYSATEADRHARTDYRPRAAAGKERRHGRHILIFVLLAAAVGGGAFYYFKILKPKQGVKGGMDISELDELDLDGKDNEF